MNLFVVDENPVTAARYLSDQHVRKMILETAQIIDGGTRPIMNNLYPNEGPHEIVKIPPSHRDNRCIHTASSCTVINYAWEHYLGLLQEFQRRFGHPHSYEGGALRGQLYNRIERAAPGMNDNGFGLFMPDEYKTHSIRYVPLAHAIASYRAYYAAEKWRFDNGPALWTRSSPPLWMVQILERKGYSRSITSDGQRQFFQEPIAA